MRKSSIGLLASVVLVMAAASSCSSGGGGGTGKGGGAGTSSSGGRGGTTGTGGRGGTTGTGGGTAGTGGGTAGTGGGTAGTGGGTAGTGGGTAGTGGTTGTAGNGGRGGGGGTGGSAGATGGATARGARGHGGRGGSGAAGGDGRCDGGHGGRGAGGHGGQRRQRPAAATPAPNPPITGTATRPQLTAGTDYTILKYFEKAGSLVTGPTTDNWDSDRGRRRRVQLHGHVHGGDVGRHPQSVQAALNAAVTAGGTARVYIKVEPGTYRETICHKSSTPPITLYSTNADASQTVIVSAGYAGKVYTNPPPTDPPWNPCAASNPPATGAIYGTSGSATVGIFAPNFQMKNLTFANDYVEVGTSNIQAVALMAQNDKLIFENVRLLGNQDTLYVKTGNPDTVQRAYFKSCYVEGDVDFIFGRGTFVLDGCEIKYLGARARRHERRRHHFAQHRLPQRIRPAGHRRHVHLRRRAERRYGVAGPGLGRRSVGIDLSSAWQRHRQHRGLSERPGRRPGLDAGRAPDGGHALGRGGQHESRVQLGPDGEHVGRDHSGQPPLGVPEHRPRRRALSFLPAPRLANRPCYNRGMMSRLPEPLPSRSTRAALRVVSITVLALMASFGCGSAQLKPSPDSGMDAPAGGAGGDLGTAGGGGQSGGGQGGGGQAGGSGTTGGGGAGTGGGGAGTGGGGAGTGGGGAGMGGGGAGMGGGAAGTGGPAVLTLAAATGASTDFGALAVAGMKDQIFIVSNQGQQPSSAFTITLSGADFTLLAPGVGDCVSGSTMLTGAGSSASESGSCPR